MPKASPTTPGLLPVLKAGAEFERRGKRDGNHRQDSLVCGCVCCGKDSWHWACGYLLCQWPMPVNHFASKHTLVSGRNCHSDVWFYFKNARNASLGFSRGPLRSFLRQRWNISEGGYCIVSPILLYSLFNCLLCRVLLPSAKHLWEGALDPDLPRYGILSTHSSRRADSAGTDPPAGGTDEGDNRYYITVLTM